MTLDDYKQTARNTFEPIVAGFERVGATPNQVSVLSFVVAVAAAGAFYVGTAHAYLAASFLVALSGLLDGIDGELARRTDTTSAQGDMLDHTLDRYSDLIIVAGIAGGLGSWALGLFAVTGVFLTSYMGTQAQAVGAGRDYGGALGRADRLVLVIVVAALHPFFAPVVVLGETLTFLDMLLVFFGVVGNITALQRFWSSWKALEGE